MKTLLIILSLLISLSIFSQNWSQITDFPGSPRDDGTVFKIQNKAYCGTGRDAGFAVTSDFKAFDLGTEMWSSIASLPDSCKRQYATAFVHNDQGYLFGGINSSGEYLTDLWMYSPVQDQWSFVSYLPDVGRSGMLSFVLGSKAYIVGGKTEFSNATNELWEFDLITMQWSQKNGVPNNGIWRGIHFQNDTTAYIGMGRDSLNQINTMLYHYLPSSDQWQVLPGLQTIPRYYVGYTQMGDSLYMYGGVDSTSIYSNAFERINIANLTVDVLNSFPSDARKGVMAFGSDLDFYLTTGISTTARLDETWVARSSADLESLKRDQIHIYQQGYLLIVNGILKWEKIELHTAHGALLKEFDSNERLEIKDVKSGVYFWRMETEEGQSYSGRLFIM